MNVQGLAWMGFKMKNRKSFNMLPFSGPLLVTTPEQVSPLRLCLTRKDRRGISPHLTCPQKQGQTLL